MPVIHYLTVQVCKRVFIEPDYGVMRSSEPLTVDLELSMQPLCLFGISVSDLPLNYTEYYERMDSDISLSRFLKSFWSRYYKTGAMNPLIFGKPNLLIIDHRIQDLINESFYSWLSLNNIKYEFSDSKNKKAIANFRQHQNFPNIDYLSPIEPQEVYKTKNEKYALPLSVLNTRVNLSDRIHILPKHRKTLNGYRERPMRPMEFIRITADISNDINLHKIKPISSKADRELKAAYWVNCDYENGIYGFLQNRKLQEMIDSERDEKKAFLAVIKSLPATQWSCNFNSYQIDLLNKLKKQRFKDTIDIDELNYDDMCFNLGLNSSSHYTVLALETSKVKKSEMVELWNQYSHGGDVRYSCEFTFSNWYSSRNDKIYRFFYLDSWNNNIFFICESGSPASKAFDTDQCINFSLENNLEIHNLTNIKDIEYFDEFLLNNRQYLIKVVKEINSYLNINNLISI